MERTGADVLVREKCLEPPTKTEIFWRFFVDLEVGFKSKKTASFSFLLSHSLVLCSSLQ